MENSGRAMPYPFPVCGPRCGRLHLLRGNRMTRTGFLSPTTPVKWRVPYDRMRPCARAKACRSQGIRCRCAQAAATPVVRAAASADDPQTGQRRAQRPRSHRTQPGFPSSSSVAVSSSGVAQTRGIGADAADPASVRSTDARNASGWAQLTIEQRARCPGRGLHLGQHSCNYPDGRLPSVSTVNERTCGIPAVDQFQPVGECSCEPLPFAVRIATGQATTGLFCGLAGIKAHKFRGIRLSTSTSVFRPRGEQRS